MKPTLEPHTLRLNDQPLQTPACELLDDRTEEVAGYLSEVQEQIDELRERYGDGLITHDEMQDAIKGVHDWFAEMCEIEGL